MKPPSATSIPRAPRDESNARIRNYMITMGVRILCFVLMLVITPYGWYTWVLAAGAVFLPYFAVVIANVGSSPPPPTAERPERAISAPGPQPETEAKPTVIRINEAPPREPREPGATT